MEIKNRQIKIGNSKWKIKLEESMLSEDKESSYFGMSNAIYKEIQLSVIIRDGKGAVRGGKVSRDFQINKRRNDETPEQAVKS